MKKGYQCPGCGNGDTESLMAIIPGSSPLAVLLAGQKTLRRPDVQIRCSRCNLQAAVDPFRTRRRPDEGGAPTGTRSCCAAGGELGSIP